MIDDETGAVTEPRLAAALRAERRIRGLLDTHHRVHELIMERAPLSSVLDTLVRGVQEQTDGLRGSILLLDAEHGQLRHASAPDLPPKWCEMIDGIEIGPNVGSCGTSAYTGKDVLVPDVREDERWAAYQEAAVGLGLVSCWSVPIRGSEDRVMGTVAFYGSRPTTPTAEEVDLLHQMARLAAVALERDEVGRELRSLASTDPLTGLPNRTAILRHLERELWTSGGSPVAVLFVDLDRFKLINDTLGHDTGDAVLRQAAQALSGALRGEDLVGRWGGDEFVVVPAPHARSADAVHKLAQRLSDALRSPLQDGRGHRHAISASIGITLACETNALEAIRQADTAMYAAKRSDRGITAFSAEVDEQRSAELRIVDGLRTALDRHELRLAYQPIVDLRTGLVTGVEALLRWVHPQLGDVPPSRFVPIAEEHGLMAPIEAWVLDRAIEQALFWNSASGRAIALAINLSPAQSTDCAFADRILERLAESRLDPSLLRLEVTEGAAGRNLGGLSDGLGLLRDRGVRIFLDDFGTRRASLRHLRDLPVDGVKIDPSFVADLVDQDATNAGALLRGVAGLAEGMGLEVVAEGVETPEQARAARDAGIPFGQGFLFAPPMPGPAITAEIPVWSTTGGRSLAALTDEGPRAQRAAAEALSARRARRR